MAANSPVFCLFSMLSLLVVINVSAVRFGEGRNGGFSCNLIHRDSPVSPLHNPSKSYFESLNEAFHRSISRADYFKKRILDSRPDSTFVTAESIQSHITSVNGEYLMKVSIGTPPVDILAIADTGSDLTWTQCKPCSQCYAQDAPLFDPGNTSTYQRVSCESQLCVEVGSSNCDSENNCGYRVSYGDNSSSIGDISAETFTFESSSGTHVSIPKVVFGCGHHNGGIFVRSSSGIIGLGGGAVSIVKQLSSTIGGRFSYCLVPIDSGSNVSSKINFSQNAVVSGPRAVSTPLIKKSPDTFYYLTLEGISVGNNRISNKGLSNPSNFTTPEHEGNIIIDSGTTFTMLPRDFYHDLEETLSNTIIGTRVSDPEGDLGLCYKLEEDIKLPNPVVHFTDADILLPPTSTFHQVFEGAICLTFVRVDDISIFGNLSQMNFLIGYDLVNKKLTFLPADCTKED